MRYITEYNSAAEIQAALQNGELGYPYVALNKETGEIVMGEDPAKAFENEYFSVKNIENKVGTLTMHNTRYTNYEIKVGENGTWASATGATLNPGENLYIRIISANTDDSTDMLFTTDFLYTLQGNIMSLVWGSEFQGKIDFPSGAVLGITLCGADKLTSCNCLVFPAISVPAYGYRMLFFNSRALVDGPSVLPATTVGHNAYSYMFNGCSKLRRAPKIMATTFEGNRNCDNMFSMCISLVSASVPPATVLTSNCYNMMYFNCDALAEVPALPATTLASSCYVQMFESCHQMKGVAVLPAAALVNDCYRDMFHECWNLQGIDIEATTYYSAALMQMINTCSNITYIKCGINADTGIESGFCDDVAAEGMFVKNRLASQSDIATLIPDGWTITEADF